MVEYAEERLETASYPVSVSVEPALEGRNRWTTAFRFFLALPHLIIIGGPVAVISSGGWSRDSGLDLGYGSGGVLGVLGVVVVIVAVIAWFAILLTARHPDALWKFGSFYLRWRARAIAYMTLLRDEYPPFGEDGYRSISDSQRRKRGGTG